MPRPLSCEEESLVDYFVIATKLFDGSPTKLSFVYPPVEDDHDEAEFCENVTMFTFPHGYVHSWDGKSLPPPPAHNLFALTDAQGDHLYGASISFFETANHVKSLCLLARRPFYTQMLRYLEQLLLLGLHQSRATTGGNDTNARNSVEKSLCNLFHEVPVPYRGLSVQMQVGDLEIVLERPPFLDFPFEVDAELMLYAFMMIDPKVLQQLYHHVLLEHRVLIVGNDSVLVTAVVETLKSLVFPLVWLHVVIPNIPDSLDLNTLLDAPVSFIAGAHTGQLQHVAIPSNVVKYDLTESRLVVPSTACRQHQQYQEDPESVILPPLPEASTRLLQKLSTTRLADLHTQKKELHQKLWDRRIQLQKCCMATSNASNNNGTTAVCRVPVITPKNFFLMKQSLVHKKMMKLYLEVIASLLQDFPQFVSHQIKRFESDKFIDKKPSQSRPFYRAFVDTAQFQSFIALHSDYVAGHLALEDAMKFQFVHKTLLSTERITGNQADASLAVAMALTKTFVALVPQVADMEPGSEQETREPLDIKTTLEVVFPTLNLDAFGEARQIQFPSMSTDAVYSSLGTFISPSGFSSRRASRDTSDWMQSFMRTVPLPSAIMRLDSLSASSYSSCSNSNNNSIERSIRGIFGSSATTPIVDHAKPAPFKRSRTIDRLRKASPFYRTMTQKALDSTLSSLASAAAGIAASSSPPTRPSTVVRSIWLITTSSCVCRDRIVLLTQKLVEQLQIHSTKSSPQVSDAYCDLINALSSCRHPSEAKAVFEECLSGSALLSLGPIASMPYFWKPFSALIQCYISNGLVQRAFDLLLQVEIEEEQQLDPSMGALQFAAQVLCSEKEAVVERLYVTFSCGNMGMCLAPRLHLDARSSANLGCEVISFQDEDTGAHDEPYPTEETHPQHDLLEMSCGLRVHDVIETVNGEFVLHRAFQDVITLLKQASRPMTVTFVRGLDRLHTLTDPDATDARRSSSSVSTTSFSSTSAVLDGRSGIAPSSTSKSKPRRDLCDRFGLLPQRGIRITALADCEGCGTRLSLAQVQSGWSSNDANDYTTRCFSCGHRFVPRLCVMLGVMTTMYKPSRTGAPMDRVQLPQDAKVEQLEYLSTPVIRKELNNLAQRVPLTLLPMKDLREMHPRIYWNIIVKLLSLEVPLDFMDLPDAPMSQEKEVEPPNPPTAKPSIDDDEMRAIREMIMRRAERIKRERPEQRMEETLSSVLKALDLQINQEWQGKFSSPRSDAGRKGWSILGSTSLPSCFAGTNTAVAPLLPPSLGQVELDSDREVGGNGKHRRTLSDEERETDFEDMRSSRTMSITDSIASDDLSHSDAVRPKKAQLRASKFMPSMPSLPSAPFRRSSRATHGTR